MTSITAPDYDGGSLVNLMAELEQRLTGSAPFTPLHPELAALIPEAESYLVMLFDGLGDHQLDHRAAATLRASRAGALDAPFPTTTTVSMASIATGLPPARHGLLAYQQWMPDLGQVANTIWWTTLWGESLGFDTVDFLPAPNLWERLTGAGAEPITVQPRHFEGSKLSDLLYRGCRHEPYDTVDELADIMVELAAVPGRLVFGYLSHVDFAAHVSGQDSETYDQAMEVADRVWSRIIHRLPAGAAVVGTADHGHVDFPRRNQHKLPKREHEGRILYGDGRVLMVRGDGASLAARYPAQWVPLEEMAAWWGPGPPHPAFAERAPDGGLVAADGHLLLHRFSDDRMIGNHGGLSVPERRIPLLVAAGD